MSWTQKELDEIAKTYESNRDNWIKTFSGNKVNFADLQEDSISIEDVAHALSNICRYNGHVNQFYSVAQHSILTLYLVTEMGGSTEERMQALLHDAPEAYIGDMPAPLKDLLPFYQKMEKKVATVVGDKLEVDLVNLSEKVKQADYTALGIEAHAFFENVDWIDKPEYNRVIQGVSGENGELVSMHPSMGKNAFMNEYWNLKLKLDKENE